MGKLIHNGTDPGFRKRLADSIYAAAALSFTLFFFAPALAYFNNYLEFRVSFSDILPHLAAVSFSASAVIAVLILLWRRDNFSRAVSLVAVSAVFVWVKANILLWDYGVLDGTRFDWSSYGLRNWIDIGLCLAALAAALIFFRFFYRAVRRIAMILVVIQLVALFYSSGNARLAPSVRGYDFDMECISRFSSRRNIIVLIIDGFRSDLFEQLVKNNPSYRQAFDGFTFYPNAVSGTSTTRLSLALIFSGRYYESKYDYEGFVRKECRPHFFPAVLKEHQYRVELHNIPDKACYYDASYVANMVRRPIGPGELKNELGLIYRCGYFRCVPQFIKKIIYAVRPGPAFAASGDEEFGEDFPWTSEMSPADSYGHDVGFMRKLVANASASLDTPVMKMIYVRGVHPPFGLDAPGEPGKYDCASYRAQAEWWLSETCDLLERMKKSGIYDNSLIFIVADHGARFDRDCISGMNISYIQRGMGLITVKPFDSRGDLRISRAPVCLADIPKTVMDAAGLPEGDYPGMSIFKVKEGEKRVRLQLQTHKQVVDRFGRTYFKPLEIYGVSGPVRLHESWEFIKGEK